MSDVFWAAIISGGTAIVVTLLTQWLSLRIASQQSARLERTEQLKWERSESSRKEAMLRECLEHVLTAQIQMRKRVNHYDDKGRWDPVAEIPASVAAAHAYTIALRGLADVYPQMKALYDAAVRMEDAMDARDGRYMKGAEAGWASALDDLEKVIARLSGVAPVQEATLDDAAAPIETSSKAG